MSTVDGAGGQTLITSVQRALHLLDAVGGATRPVPAKALARQVGLPLATTYHLLRTLVYEGYLRKLPDGYVLGDRLLTLRSGNPMATALGRTRPILAGLRDQLGGAAYLSLLVDGEIVLVDVADGPATPRVDLWVGFDEASHATALGKCVLSCLDPPAQEEYLSRHRPVELTPRTVTDLPTLLRMVRSHRTVTVDDEEYAIGTACLAAPVRAPGVLGAVAVSVPRRRLPGVLPEQATLRHAAARLSRALAITN